MALISLSGGYSATIDAIDAAAVAGFNWRAVPKKRSVYAKTYGTDGDIYLHRFLWNHWGMPPTPEIDHENGDGLDNRRLNLRAASHPENCQNTRVFKETSSGIKGVYFDRCTGKWRAEVRADRERFRLGRFASLDEAAAVVSAARSRLHGQFANDG